MVRIKTLYDMDFNLWVEAQLLVLKEQRYDDLDLSNLLEEIEDLTKRDKRALRSYLRVLFNHLLKWQYQADQRSNSWQASISNSRIEIADILEDSPSLRNYLPEVLEKSYQGGRKIAAKETGFPLDRFPASYPYSLEQALDWDFLPDASK